MNQHGPAPLSTPVSRKPGQQLQIVSYPSSDRWVGRMKCEACHYTVWAWRASDVSDCWPHFYCNRCSNTIHRKADQFLAWADQSTRTLSMISATLPACPCGGHFRTDARPKCPVCRSEFGADASPVERLTDPGMIVLNGSCLFSDTRGPLRVRIDDCE